MNLINDVSIIILRCHAKKKAEPTRNIKYKTRKAGFE